MGTGRVAHERRGLLSARLYFKKHPHSPEGTVLYGTEGYDTMIRLLKNAHVYAPTPLGKKDLLIVGKSICRIDDHIEGYEGLQDVEVFDLEGRCLVPGFVDLHVHITGGGGEQGPTSRVPESQLSVFLRNGITTVVGMLGTDGITRSLENLVAKARALDEEGMTAYTLTGSYGYPTSTITGSIEKDIMMVSPMIGVKVAVSDHRSSSPTGRDLIRIATEARRGGLLSATAGLVTMHMGSGKEGLGPVFDALEHSDIPAKNLLPTHIQRTPELVEQGAELIRRGGYIDFTAGCNDAELKVNADRLMLCLDMEGVDFRHITISSDAYGSQPRFNSAGECIGLTYASPNSLLQTLRILVQKGLPLDTALCFFTSNPAELLGKQGTKGCVAQGADADLIVFDDNFEIAGLFARGKAALWDGQLLMKGKFE